MKNFVIHNEKEIKGFFGNEEKKGYRWLSNFYGAPIYFNGKKFPTNEHAYQFAKLRPAISVEESFCQDEEYLKIILMTTAQVKKWGSSIPIRKDWDAIKYDVMASINFDKYFRNIRLREKLLETGSKYLEETNNWHDNYWGNCECLKCGPSSAIQPRNNLGKILMKIRSFWS